ncbi:tetratricopeptide repeat protein [Thiorhodospira sibirica]|uniref:tetratricopeptide repeat protein n=1 Tax=Thiorhodospira sibirica TaxID=154347 RepID=UPI00022C5E5A|nr:tetratricopeptide repeat protein [Thiorhodospira sibirica]
MTEFLWLLLPVAAASGWFAARKAQTRQRSVSDALKPAYLRGLGYLLNEQSDHPLEVFGRMVEQDRDTVETHLILGSLFRRRGEVDKAIQVHQALIEHAALDQTLRAQATLELARDYLKAGVLDRAEALFKTVLTSGHLQSESAQCLCRLYEQEKEWEKAIWAAQQWTRYSTQKPTTQLAHYFCERADLALHEGQLVTAKTQALQALTTDPFSVRARLLLGQIALQDADYPQAVLHCSKAIEQDMRLAVLVLPCLHAAYQAMDAQDPYRAFLSQISQTAHTDCSRLAVLQALEDSGEHTLLDALLHQEIERESLNLGVLALFIRQAQRQGQLGSAKVVAHLQRVLDQQLSERPRFGCQHCGFKASAHFWCCPSCHT